MTHLGIRVILPILVALVTGLTSGNATALIFIQEPPDGAVVGDSVTVKVWFKNSDTTRVRIQFADMERDWSDGQNECSATFDLAHLPDGYYPIVAQGLDLWDVEEQADSRWLAGRW